MFIIFVISEIKPKPDKPERKVRQTRWNDEPAIPLAQLNILNAQNVLNSQNLMSSQGAMNSQNALNPQAPFMNPVFNSLTLQDQQKLQEYQVRLVFLCN